MKTFLTFLLCLPLILHAQESDKSQVNQNSDFKKDVFVPVTGSSQPVRKYNKKPVLSPKVVGQSFYDLQTNGSSPRRLIAYPDGRVSVVWTNAETQGFDNRGTGYNHFNGSNWLPLTSVDYRIENENDIRTPNRVGWANIGHVGTSKEFTISHSATFGGFVYSENNQVGGTNWSSSEIFSDGPLWGRIAQGSNNYLYLIGTYTILTPGDTPTVDGIVRPVVFYRSSDNGNTWMDEAMLLPGYDTSRYRFGSADSYSIDAQDSVVAIVVGTSTTDLALWKSTDWGTTWTKTVVDSFPLSPAALSAGTQNFDTTYHNDGSYHVVLDNNNNAHVFWGMRTIFRNDDNDPGEYWFLRDSNSLGYWNEASMQMKIVARVVDEDNSGSNLDGVPRTNFNRLPDGETPAFLYGGGNLVNMPSASIDANGNIYCVYRAVVESPMSDPFTPVLEANFSDIYVIYSTNGGTTWSQPQNLTKTGDDFSESVFPSTYRRIINGELHLVWQEDAQIGTAAQGQHSVDTNNIMYNSFPVSDILANRYGPTAVSVKEMVNNVFSVARTYPNPATDMVNVELNLKKGTAVTIAMRNMLGQEISNQNFGKMSAGNHLLPFNTTNLKSGIYFITISAEGFSSTHKVVVQ